MSGPAVRSRLLGLRARLEAARIGRGLLDQKREVLLRELRRRTAEARKLEAEARESLAVARAAATEARIRLGAARVCAAGLAQPPAAGVTRSRGALVGVALPLLRVRLPPFRPRYAPATAHPALDRAGEAWTAALPRLLALGEARAAVAALQGGLARTTRRLNALDHVVVPDLLREIRAITEVLEEEERAGAVRARCFGVRGGSPTASPSHPASRRSIWSQP